MGYQTVFIVLSGSLDVCNLGGSKTGHHFADEFEVFLKDQNAPHKIRYLVQTRKINWKMLGLDIGHKIKGCGVKTKKEESDNHPRKGGEIFLFTANHYLF